MQLDKGTNSSRAMPGVKEKKISKMGLISAWTSNLIRKISDKHEARDRMVPTQSQRQEGEVRWRGQ